MWRGNRVWFFLSSFKTCSDLYIVLFCTCLLQIEGKVKELSAVISELEKKKIAVSLFNTDNSLPQLKPLSLDTALDNTPLTSMVQLKNTWQLNIFMTLCKALHPAVFPFLLLEMKCCLMKALSDSYGRLASHFTSSCKCISWWKKWIWSCIKSHFNPYSALAFTWCNFTYLTWLINPCLACFPFVPLFSHSLPSEYLSQYTNVSLLFYIILYF